MVFVNRGKLDDVLDYHLPTGSVHRDSFKAFVEGVSEDKTKQMNGAMKGISSGAIGMNTNVGDWVTYVSSAPITGFCDLPISPNKYPSFDEYIGLYLHMIMSISSFDGRAAGRIKGYEHRGIFRNPLSMLRGDFRGLGLLIHGFTAQARLAMDPNYLFMQVNTDGNSVMEGVPHQVMMNVNGGRYHRRRPHDTATKHRVGDVYLELMLRMRTVPSTAQIARVSMVSWEFANKVLGRVDPLTSL